MKEYGPGLVSPFQTHRSTYFFLSAYGIGVERVHQPTGKALECVADNDIYYNPDFKCHLTISKNRSNSHVFFAMSTLDSADTATYYFARKPQ
jgi:immunoglobulin heavy chain